MPDSVKIDKYLTCHNIGFHSDQARNAILVQL